MQLSIRPFANSIGPKVESSGVALPSPNQKTLSTGWWTIRSDRVEESDRKETSEKNLDWAYRTMHNGTKSFFFSMRSFYLRGLKSESRSRSAMIPAGDRNSRATKSRRLVLVPHLAGDFHSISNTRRDLKIISNNCALSVSSAIPQQVMQTGRAANLPASWIESHLAPKHQHSPAV